MQDILKHLLLFCAYSGVSIVLFLLLLLSKTWRNQRSNKILAFILFSFLVIVLLYLTVPLGSATLQAFLLPLGIVSPYTLGPLLFFYIQLIYQPQMMLGKAFFYHLLPFCIAFVVFSIPLGLVFYFSPQYLTNNPFIAIIPVTGVLFMGYYFYRCARLLTRYKALVKNNYSSLSKVDLHWLTIWVKGLILFAILDSLTGILVAAFPWLVYLIYINALYLVCLIWYIGYFGLQQTNVFLSEISMVAASPSPVAEPAVVPEEKPVAKSIFKDEAEIRHLTKKLEEVVGGEELYKDESISLYKIAQRLHISDKKLSELINKELNTNFYEFINNFRVAAFKERVENGDAKRFTLLAIAYESGFNSKATFNRIFKKQTGLTPSQFKKQAEAQAKY